MNQQPTSIAVLGAGSWGTALAIVLNRTSAKATLWGRNKALVKSMQETRINNTYLPDNFIDPSITITDDLLTATEADILVLAVPAQSLRNICVVLSDMIPVGKPIIVASKGLEQGSMMLMSDIVELTLPANPCLILSGPNFAAEAAASLPTATVLASTHKALLEQCQFMMAGKYFRPYATDDVVSVQIGGAIKNVIAIACGITLGAGLGENARAAIITRGLSEMMRLAELRGGRIETLHGLAGVGDLVLTCGSPQSRNMALGIAIGESSQKYEEMPISLKLTEGSMTSEAVYEMAMKQGIHMPISITVADILQQRISVEEGIDRLLSRPPGYE